MPQTGTWQLSFPSLHQKHYQLTWMSLINFLLCYNVLISLSIILYMPYRNFLHLTFPLRTLYHTYFLQSLDVEQRQELLSSRQDLSKIFCDDKSETIVQDTEMTVVTMTCSSKKGTRLVEECEDTEMTEIVQIFINNESWQGKEIRILLLRSLQLGFSEK